LKEQDIRPDEMFQEYLRLAEEDVKNNFRDVSYQFINCPACKSTNTTFAFQKTGLNYEYCEDCMTIFLNPRPNAEAFHRYCQKGSFVTFWAQKMYKQTESSRREKIIAPRAQMTLEKIRKFGNFENIGIVADIGAGYGTFCQEMAKLVPAGVEVLAIEPATGFADICREKGLNVVPKYLETMTPADFLQQDEPRSVVFTSFDVLEHLHDPLEFLTCCWKLLKPDDLMIMSMPSGTGLDVLELWERSKNLAPPHHINFFNPISIEILLSRSGFETCDIITPGKLDVNILENNVEYITDRFILTFLKMADQKAKDDFQAFVQKHNLSSHMMVTARRSL